MKLLRLWKMFLFNLWIHVGFMPGLHCNTGIVNHLSKQDVLLLKDMENPKCFTRTEDDFTCFFQTTDNKTYDIFYKHVNNPRKRCEISVQRTEEGDFLHICPFPESDVGAHSEIEIQVVERATKTTYSRTACVEDHFLLDPPWNVSLNPNGVGHLQVSWHTEFMEYKEAYKRYRIRYSTSSFREKTIEAETNSYSLELTAGEVVEVQVAVKVAFDSAAGHWSGWSQPVRAVVPQIADDISLTCYTSDLQNVVCQWKRQTFGTENEYKLFYKMDHGGSWDLGSEWTKCLGGGHLTNQCYFRGNESRQIKVKLSSTSAPLSRTFYSAPFKLSNIIKPFPPRHLKYEFKQGKLCFDWEAPRSSLQTGLRYEVNIQPNGDNPWTKIIGPETVICEQIPVNSQVRAKIRATASGANYSGSWSEWSQDLTVYNPPDLVTSAAVPSHGVILEWNLAVLIPVIATISICIFGLYRNKLKQYFWPPVPNLEKVLQDFLTEINKQKWESPVTVKECFEETTSSVVEVITEVEAPGLDKLSEESSELLSSDGSFSSGELTTGSPGTEVFPDYVTLNKEFVIPCLEGNSYVSELTREKREPEVGDECLQICICSCTDSSSCVKPYSDFTNRCYLLITESTDRFTCKIHGEKSPGNLYTNLPRS